MCETASALQGVTLQDEPDENSPRSLKTFKSGVSDSKTHSRAKI